MPKVYSINQYKNIDLKINKSSRLLLTHNNYLLKPIFKIFLTQNICTVLVSGSIIFVLVLAVLDLWKRCNVQSVIPNLCLENLISFKCDTKFSLIKISSDLLIEAVVVAHERIERPQLHPSRTQLGCRVIDEAANVRPHLRNAKQLEVQNPCNRIKENRS